jgi:hypothetical protein
MRKIIAGALLALSLTACIAPGYDRWCPASWEDSSTAHCNFDPNARYDYDHGAWRQVADDFRYVNGNRPPLGSEI